jgi:prolipoprotein diacylglyceryl transferase
VAFIPSPPSNGLHLGPLFIHAYGLAYALAVMAAVAITVRRWAAVGGQRELVYEVALCGFPAGLLGGRLYFLATSWSEVPPHWWGPLAVWKGGLGIWGGIAAGTLAGLWVLRRRRANVAAFMDAAAPALLVAQAIGRIGNYFNQELFGGPTTLPWALEISPAHRPLGYAQYATFHPTFLYELIWNVLLAAALVWLGHHRRIRAPGLFALYVAGYSLGTHRRGAAARRSGPPHLRSAPEPLCGERALPRWHRMVHAYPARHREKEHGPPWRGTPRGGRPTGAHRLRAGFGDVGQAIRLQLRLRKHAERCRARRIVDGSVEREPRVAVRLEIGWLHLETVCKPNRVDDNSGCGWDPDFPSGPLRGRQALVSASWPQAGGTFSTAPGLTLGAALAPDQPRVSMRMTPSLLSGTHSPETVTPLPGDAS